MGAEVGWDKGKGARSASGEIYCPLVFCTGGRDVKWEGFEEGEPILRSVGRV